MPFFISLASYSSVLSYLDPQESHIFALKAVLSTNKSLYDRLSDCIESIGNINVE